MALAKSSTRVGFARRSLPIWKESSMIAAKRSSPSVSIRANLALWVMWASFFKRARFSYTRCRGMTNGFGGGAYDALLFDASRLYTALPKQDAPYASSRRLRQLATSSKEHAMSKKPYLLDATSLQI